jgi:hypothetical protein
MERRYNIVDVDDMKAAKALMEGRLRQEQPPPKVFACESKIRKKLAMSDCRNPI